MIAAVTTQDCWWKGPGEKSSTVCFSVVRSLQAENATNVGAGLELACSTALDQQLEPGQVRRMVLLTDGLARVRRGVVKRIEGMLADAAGRGVALQVISVGGQQNTTELETLAHTMRPGGGEMQNLSDADDLQFALLETLTSQRQVVAREASLRVSFNPGQSPPIA